MRGRFAFIATTVLVLIVVSGVASYWGTPVSAYDPASKTKDPHPTKEEKPTKAPHATKEHPTDRPAPTDVPPTPVPPTDIPPTDIPPTAVPPTQVPVPPTNTPVPTAIPPSLPTETSTPTRLREQPPVVDRPSPSPLPTETQTATIAAVPSEPLVPTEQPVTTATAPARATVEFPSETSTLVAAPVRTGTPTVTPTRSGSLAGIIVPTPFALKVTANELLVRPQSVDWNGDGVIDDDDEWIEIYNSGQSRVDLSGWFLTAVIGGDSITYTFPPGTSIAANSYRVFYAGQTKLYLSRSGGEVRLLYPDHRVADLVRYPELGLDQSYVKASDRGNKWTAECVPSPHAPNCTAGATLTSTFNLSYFEKHIADATLVQGLDRAALAVNALLAIILAFIAGLYGDMLHSALNGRNGNRIVSGLAALSRPLREVNSAVNAHNPSRILFWVGTPIKLAALFLACGFIFAFLDPSFDLNEVDGWLLILALACSIGLVSVGVLVAQRLVLRLSGTETERRARRNSLLLALLATVFSRLVGFVPGILITGPTGFRVGQHRIQSRLSFAAIGTLFLLGLGAWALSPFLETDAWFKTVALLTFAMAVQTLLLEMLPVGSLHGRAVFESNRPAWFVLYALTALGLLQTMVNPDSSPFESFLSPAVFALAVAAVAFAITSVILWQQVRAGRAGAASQEASRSAGK